MTATEEQHATAVIGFLNGLSANAFDPDDLPSPRPENYTEVHLARRYGGVMRGDAIPDGQLYRLLVRQVGRTVTNARQLRANIASIEGSVLTVNGRSTTPVTFESADVIAPDDGWYSGSQTWTYALI